MRLYTLFITLLLCCSNTFLVDARTGGGGVQPDETKAPAVPSSPSISPSSSPSSFEAVEPDDTTCRTTNGVYGDTLDGTTTPQVVSYSYAVTVKEGTSSSEVSSLVLPELEISMTNLVLRNVFTNCIITGSSRKSRHQRRQLDDDKVSSGIIGISTRPIDTIEDDIQCPTTGTSNCYGIFGTLTIFLKDDDTTVRRHHYHHYHSRVLQESSSSSSSSHVTLVREILKTSMDNGYYNTNVSESIMNVTWVDDGTGDDNGIVTPPTGNDDESNNTDRSTTNDDSNVIAWTVGMSAAAILLLIAAATVVRRRRRGNNDDDNDTNTNNNHGDDDGGESGIEISTITPGTTGNN